MSNKDVDVGAQYATWGLLIRTNRLRGAHIANGLVQLMRLLPHAPPAGGPGIDPRSYIRAVESQLDLLYPNGKWRLSDPARAVCVTSTDAGPFSAPPDGNVDDSDFVEAGRKHFDGVLSAHSQRSTAAHQILAAALNADGVVYKAGGDDPTTPGLSFAGYTSTHTLAGMHAATFLGLLTHTPDGTAAASALYGAFGSADDVHSRLVDRLGLSLEVSPHQGAVYKGAFPLPGGAAWERRAARTGLLAKNLMSWRAGDGGKAELLMAVVDLASLLLFLSLVEWGAKAEGPRPLLLMVSTRSRSGGEAVRRAQQSLLNAMANLDSRATDDGLTPDGDIYSPSRHAKSLGAAGGWLFPTESRGGPKRWFSPGARQLATLVHCLLKRGEEVSWADFARRAEENLFLAMGGVDEPRVAEALGFGGGVNSLRWAGRANQDHLVSLGLARQESDNVIVVDGGGR